jgi:hypothetical protein
VVDLCKIGGILQVREAKHFAWQNQVIWEEDGGREIDKWMIKK